MKIILLLITIIIFFNLPAFAQENTFYKATKLVAYKNKQKKMYAIGSKLIVYYKKNGNIIKVKGKIKELNKNEVYIKLKTIKDSVVGISLDSITLIRAISPVNRLVCGIVGTTIIAIGLLSLDYNTLDSPSSAMRNTIIATFIGAGSVTLLAIPFSILIEESEETKIKNGWSFTTN